ncbi:GlxA family transcriptional regulator [Roseovarius sp. SCSIO 43702]|uniref:GlxA family transcriptional regulator n=1 Tax=Roseovarius sp. SCSIO 43702 TaxID=2823043 RepID=UPI001C734692|nr:GlxA family transcriptional regulator [Roseovarius sp. SCSIO 43702]QYX58167.1 GlxA family transcriptional regulator [Roseovarius sp. SCSIO 43702]
MEPLPSRPVDLVLLLTPHFNIAATMAFLDPFRVANYLGGRQRFRWRLVSEAGGMVVASNGTRLETEALEALGDTRPEIVIVTSSWTPERFASRAVLTAIRRFARAGAYLGALDTGAMILAEAGLLTGRRATVHYEHIDAMAERFPDVEVVEDLFVHEGRTGSACGGVAAGEYALTLLRGLVGDALTNDCAKYLFVGEVRGPGTRQTDARREPLGNTAPPKVRRAIDIMERHLEEPVTIAEIAHAAGLSQRQLDRLFRRYVRVSPQVYYRDIRLDRARGLVTQTEMPIAEVALASGFASPVYFGRAYKARFGLAPSRDRIEGRVPFEFRAWPMQRAGGE